MDEVAVGSRVVYSTGRMEWGRGRVLEVRRRRALVEFDPDPVYEPETKWIKIAELSAE